MFRRILIQISIVAGCVAVCWTLWLPLATYHLDFAEACLRSVGVGLTIMGVSIVIRTIIEKMGGPSA
jgi:uncharacterized protein YjeT (DUF2065 family)